MKAILLGFVVFGIGMSLSASVVSQPTDPKKETAVIMSVDTCHYDFDFDSKLYHFDMLHASELVVTFMAAKPLIDSPAPISVKHDKCGLFPLPRSGLRCRC